MASKKRSNWNAFTRSITPTRFIGILVLALALPVGVYLVNNFSPLKSRAAIICDMNGDAKITTVDRDLFNKAYASRTQVPPDFSADLNKDRFVNDTDQALFNTCYSQSTSPTTPQASISFNPDVTSVSTSKVSNVKFIVDVGSNTVPYASVFISFDKTKLRVASDITPNQQYKDSIQVSTPAKANELGVLQIYLATKPGQVSPNGRIELATVPFVATTSTPGTSIVKFEKGGSQLVDGSAQNYIVPDASLTVQINAGPTPIVSTITPTKYPVTPTLAQGTNLIKNPGFELDTNNDFIPDNWSSDGKISRAQGVVASGNYALMAASQSGPSFIIYQNITGVTSGKTYKFSEKVHIPVWKSVNGPFNITLRWYDKSGNTIRKDLIKTYTTSFTGWDSATGTVTAPANTDHLQVRMEVNKLYVNILVDDVSLVVNN